MIAKYNFESKIDDYIRGQVLHQDGISLGGDQLVKRLLETIIVPAFADSLGLEEEDVQVLFGPEVPRNRELRAQRVNWMNRLFVPLAQAYLNNAGDDVGRTDYPHRSRAGRPGGRRIAAKGLRPSPRAGLLQRPAGVEPGLRQDRVRGRGLRHLRRPALRLLPSHRRARDRRRDPRRAAVEAGLHPAAREDVRALVAVADRGHAQPLCRQLVSVPGREGPQSRRDHRSQEPRGGGRGDRVHGPPRHAAPVQVRHEGPHAREHLLLGRDDRRHLGHPAGTHPLRARHRAEPRGHHRVPDQFAARAHRPQAQRRRRGPGHPGLSLEDRSGRSHRADADQREGQAQARHQGPGRGPRNRPGHRRRGRRGRRARRERVLLLADAWPTNAITSTRADWTISNSETGKEFQLWLSIGLARRKFANRAPSPNFPRPSRPTSTKCPAARARTRCGGCPRGDIAPVRPATAMPWPR